MTSRFRMAVLDETGKVAKGWEPGDRVEVEMAKDLSRRVRARGVGLFRTEAHVIKDVEDAFAEMLHELKRRV